MERELEFFLQIVNHFCCFVHVRDAFCSALYICNLFFLICFYITALIADHIQNYLNTFIYRKFKYKVTIRIILTLHSQIE